MRVKTFKKVFIVILGILMAFYSVSLILSANYVKNSDISLNSAGLNKVIYAGNGISPRQVIIGSGGDGSMSEPYTDDKWNGRVKIYDYFEGGPSSDLYIEVNVDPRNSIFGDDIIIEYRHYSKTHYLGQESNVKLAYFEAKIEYYNINGIMIAKDMVSKSNDAVAGFTKNSSSTVVEGVRVQVYARGGRDGLTSKYIFFKFGTAPRFTSYI